MVALVMANAFVEKFGGDSLGEMRRNYTTSLDHVARRLR
jgi:chorismate synthase